MTTAVLRKTFIRGTLAIPLLLLAAGIVAARPSAATERADPGAGHGHAAADARLTPGALVDLVRAQIATARFHDIEVAKAAGYPVDITPECLDFPDGYMGFGPGAMGHHYFNRDLFLDGTVLDVTKPEILLYEKRADGTYRLTGVEYVIDESFLPPAGPAPRLFDRDIMFHPHFGVWALHVWIWKFNPYGVFADVNPRVTCLR